MCSRCAASRRAHRWQLAPADGTPTDRRVPAGLEVPVPRRAGCGRAHVAGDLASIAAAAASWGSSPPRGTSLRASQLRCPRTGASWALNLRPARRVSSVTRIRSHRRDRDEAQARGVAESGCCSADRPAGCDGRPGAGVPRSSSSDSYSSRAPRCALVAERRCNGLHPPRSAPDLHARAPLSRRHHVLVIAVIAAPAGSIQRPRVTGREVVRVAALWRYPVKSMAPQALERVEVSWRWRGAGSTAATRPTPPRRGRTGGHAPRELPSAQAQSRSSRCRHASPPALHRNSVTAPLGIVNGGLGQEVLVPGAIWRPIWLNGFTNWTKITL